MATHPREPRPWSPARSVRTVPFVGGPWDGRHVAVGFVDDHPALPSMRVLDEQPPTADVGWPVRFDECAPAPRVWTYLPVRFGVWPWVGRPPGLPPLYNAGWLWAYFADGEGPQPRVAVVVAGARPSCDVASRVERQHPGGLLLTRPCHVAGPAARARRRVVERRDVWRRLRGWVAGERRRLEG
jgi:hypothetical protein